MQIDWFTFVAQLINFAILLWLLNRFLYVPISSTISDRESAIASRIAAADSKFDEAAQLEAELRERRSGIEAETESLRRSSMKAVDEERTELLNAARNSVQQQRSTWFEELEREKQLVNQSLQTDVATTALEIARHALMDLAQEDLEDKITDRLLISLKEMDAKSVEAISQSIDGGSPVVVTTSRELDSTQQDRLEAALSDVFGKHFPVEYQHSDDPIGGIRLVIGSQEISWCVNDYVDAIADRFGQRLATS